MLKEERLDFILQKLQSDQSVKLGDLSLHLNVSEDTVRRDIEQLDRNGLCLKVRGGAIPHSPNTNKHAFNDRIHVAEHKKEVIARKALKLLQPRQTILLDGGTTAYTLATMLPQNLPLTVITNSIPVVTALIENPSVDVILAGGKLFKSSQVTIGMEAVGLLNQVRVDICFIGVCSLHHQMGVTTPFYDETEVKRVMVQRANKVVAITTLNKIGTAESYKVCDITSVDTIITETDHHNDLFAPYQALGIKMI